MSDVMPTVSSPPGPTDPCYKLCYKHNSTTTPLSGPDIIYAPCGETGSVVSLRVPGQLTALNPCEVEVYGMFPFLHVCLRNRAYIQLSGRA
jgi:hypothetical protein